MIVGIYVFLLSIQAQKIAYTQCQFPSKDGTCSGERYDCVELCALHEVWCLGTCAEDVAWKRKFYPGWSHGDCIPSTGQLQDMVSSCEDSTGVYPSYSIIDPPMVYTTNPTMSPTNLRTMSPTNLPTNQPTEVEQPKETYATISDVLLSATCKLKSKTVARGSIRKIADNSDSRVESKVIIKDCIDVSFQDRLSLRDSTCTNETLANTTVYNISLANEYKLKFRGRSGKAAKMAMRDLLEQSSTNVEGANDKQCPDEFSAQEHTVRECRTCEKNVGRKSCSELIKSASFIGVSARCRAVRQITAVKHDGSQVYYEELKNFFRRGGMKLKQVKRGGPYSLKYRSTFTMDVVSKVKGQCKLKGCN